MKTRTKWIKHRKIAILGTAPSFEDAPFLDDDWEIWVANRPGLSQKRWDRLFEIHKNWDYERPAARDRYLDELKEIKPPQQVISVVPLGGSANLVIDREALFEKYGKIWFSSTFGYMMAHALEQKPTDIGFWGVDLESHEEYVVQFSGLRHFIDIAKERGIKVHVPPRSPLLREPHAYPDRFETSFAYNLEEKARLLERRIGNAERQLELAKGALWRHLGRLEAMEEYNAPKTDVTFEKSESQEAALKVQKWQQNLDKMKGQLLATQHYKRLFVWNVLPPEMGEESPFDVEDCGPI